MLCVKKLKALLGNKYISMLPVEAIKEKANIYVVTVTTNLGELEMIPIGMREWERLCDEWIKSTDRNDIKRRKYIRAAFAYAIEYRVDDCGSMIHTGAADLMGEPGDELDVLELEDRWIIRNPKVCVSADECEK